MSPCPVPNLQFEIPLWRQDQAPVAGLDEAGRGAWAGPVSAAAVILPQSHELGKRLWGVRDSKMMTPAQRAYWAIEIQKTALAWGVGMASHLEIDQVGILPATRLAMQRALAALALAPRHLLLDAVRLAVDLPQTVLIKGDSRSLSIAAASVLAKTARDAWMVSASAEYPGYGFERNKGYGTRLHQQGLDRLGPCAIHRCTFAPVKQRLGQAAAA